MGDSPRRRATYADLCAVPDRYVAEIIGGELFVSPRPSAPHAIATSMLSGDLRPFNRRRGGSGGPGGWWILMEPELHLGEFDPRDEVLVPDLAGWRRERMPGKPEGAGQTLPPDWVCEVLSPSTARIDRVRKMQVCARVRVPQVWHVDPVAKTLEVFRLRDDVYAQVEAYEGTGRVRPEPFADVEFSLAAWWGDDDDPSE
jgi:Uma2 family endonuclease